MRAVTQAPLPGWEQIARLARSPLSDDQLVTAWLGDGDSYSWFSKSSWSLFALVQAVQAQKMGPVCVWIPDYFCNAALSPLRKIGVQFRFYPIQFDLKPDLSACRQMLAKGDPDLFVLVHYMGQSALSSAVYEFCKSANAYLVEDCAHVLEPVDGIGMAGDFVLYSLHKHLPIPDGALLVARSGGPAQTGKQRLNWMDFDSDIQSVGTDGNHIKPVALWFIKRLLQCAGWRTRPKPIVFGPTHSSAIQQPFGFLQMSGSAKRILSSVAGQISRIAGKRQSNYQKLVSGVGKTKELTDMGIAPLPMQTTAYMAGFSAPNSIVAERLFHLIRRTGFPVTTWPDLPPEVLSRPSKHSVALHLRKTRFYFPIHQSLDFTHIEKQGLELSKYV